MLTKDIYVYYLNPDSSEKRRLRMEEMLSSLGMRYERFPSNSSHKLRPARVNEGFIKLTERAMANGVYPFLVLEDDAALVGHLPEKIDIPRDAVLIYWGVSLFNCGGWKPPLYITNYGKDYYRLFHSLGCHAVLIPNKKSAQHFIKVRKSVKEGMNSDIYLAIDSGKHLYLTPKDGPYFYQNDSRTEKLTRFLFSEKKELLK